MIFGFFPFLFLPLFPILRYVAGHCPAIHSLHLFIVYLLAWWFCIQLSFLFLLCAFIFFFFFSILPSISDFLQFDAFLPLQFFLLFFFSRLDSGFCMISLHVNWRQSFSWHKLPQWSFLIQNSLLTLPEKSAFQFLRNIKEFSFTKMCSATLQENVICCHCLIHWKSSVSWGMPRHKIMNHCFAKNNLGDCNYLTSSDKSAIVVWFQLLSKSKEQGYLPLLPIIRLSSVWPPESKRTWLRRKSYFCRVCV